MERLRPFATCDLDDTVDVHLRSFQGFFLASLGGRFLKEFYRSMLLDESSIASVFERNGKVTGFIVGTLRPVGLYKRVLSRSWSRLLQAAITPVIEKPETVVRLLRRLFIARQSVYADGEALLMSLAVLPSEQGQGIGRQLVTAFLAEAKRRGASLVSLATDKFENDDVNRFYFRSGFHCRQSFTTPEGREMNEYCFGFQAGI